MCGELFVGEKEKMNDSKAFRIGSYLTQGDFVHFMDEPRYIGRHELHDCQDGSIGFGDFQGFKKLEGGK